MAVTILKPLYWEQKLKMKAHQTNPKFAEFYNSHLWRETSKRHRRHEPLCRACKAEGYIRAACVTDHIQPLTQGGAALDDANLQSLCRFHDQQKRRMEQLSHSCSLRYLTL